MQPGVRHRDRRFGEDGVRRGYRRSRRLLMVLEERCLVPKMEVARVTQKSVVGLGKRRVEGE